MVDLDQMQLTVNQILAAVYKFPGPQRKKGKNNMGMIYYMHIMCTFAKVVGAAREKKSQLFLARGGKKVAHH